jgi:hypothetical protein
LADGVRLGRLIGRDDELRRLLAAIAEGRDHAVGVMITGAPGVGKTALLEAALAPAEGFQLLHATGLEVPSELPFAGLHQLLGPTLPAKPSMRWSRSPPAFRWP